MKKRFVLATLTAVLLIGWGAMAWLPNGNTEGAQTSDFDNQEQVYFGNMGQTPDHLSCAIIKLPENPTRVEVSAALARASVIVLRRCVAIRWVS